MPMIQITLRNRRPILLRAHDGIQASGRVGAAEPNQGVRSPLTPYFHPRQSVPSSNSVIEEGSIMLVILARHTVWVGQWLCKLLHLSGENPDRLERAVEKVSVRP
jgi:hypothetical protein